jgi:Mg2+ and Co2+ transporter CorA
MLSHSATEIANRLDKGSKIAERLATIGLILAAVSALTSPFAIITGFFGMNVAEFVEGTTKTLLDFWQVAVPTITVSFGILTLVIIRLISPPKIK